MPSRERTKGRKPVKWAYRWKWQRVVLSPVCQLRPIHKTVILAMSMYAKKNGGSIRPSQVTIAVCVGCSRKTVSKAIKAAITAGYLEQTNKPERGSVATGYRLSLPPLIQNAVNTNEHGFFKNALPLTVRLAVPDKWKESGTTRKKRREKCPPFQDQFVHPPVPIKKFLEDDKKSLA